MALPLPPHPDLPAWAERHGLDASRVVAPFDVRPEPTREHPHQVRVDYVVLLHVAGGPATTVRDARTMLTCDPPPPHGHDLRARLRDLADEWDAQADVNEYEWPEGARVARADARELRAVLNGETVTP